MNKQDWQTLLAAWEAKRASKKERAGYDGSIYICNIALAFDFTECKRLKQGIHDALEKDGLSTDGWGFDLAGTHSRDGHWRKSICGTQDYTANDRRLHWLKEQIAKSKD